MEYKTITEWDELIWKKTEGIYQQAFPKEGRKSRTNIRRMFERKMCHLHLAIDNNEVIAMALTAMDEQALVLIIDYIAIREDLRSKGHGKLLINYIKEWAETTKSRGIIVEVEAESNPENTNRIRFWQAYGFRLTEYVHQYIWVPEPYQAMYLNMDKANGLPEGGEKLFQYINQYHKKAYNK
ncbi:GNAT family N-acetyltransferase [Paenibacillus psychroresistens]|uniref:GNAT family N-acetyltransferase n=1 Tax=Paenibacillus psychroresistens TaxID=1778678 RepID=A0A6B8RL48_9BACL|nr:GNAT family N-acetyltransferase [Paenibacillus psychroresistens]QGQ96484.1 GNAT family N-acetyltransferase [Paenibacillus psychroresistens]